ncbi:DUF3850 domain-containing protein [Bacillus infantis]|uniref:DUF3850 domain-containing protein n=1 Tax=Bacillus infantis TaxID=324767 RepID=A0A5D4RWN2_9BACI|nr:ASCH/PUA domain-containing protein [Bacillus infantis]TYS55805.1 DUF3850 domain-containing protein [Bacillus infantis]
MFSVNHQLKTHPEYFEAVNQGLKTFEIRKNDRGFKVGDPLLLREYSPQHKAFTGRAIMANIIYMTDFEQKEDYVVLGIKTISLLN